MHTSGAHEVDAGGDEDASNRICFLGGEEVGLIDGGCVVGVDAKVDQAQRQDSEGFLAIVDEQHSTALHL